MPVASPVEQANTVGSDPARPTILVVEDDPDIQLLITASLGAGGYGIRTASDGREALASINEEIPDLVISDVMMPEMDGLELLTLLRSDPATRRVPVIMLSAKGATNDIVTGLDLGADDYLPKPFVVSELQARVRAKMERPPVPAEELVRERHLKILSVRAFAEELQREIMRSRRGGGSGCLAVLELAELPRIRERLGSRAEAAVVKQIGRAIAEDGRALDSTGRDAAGRFLLLMPETGPRGAEVRLRRLHQLLVRHSYNVKSDSVRLTPVTGYVPYGPGSTAELVRDQAMTALDHAAIRLDLEPIRYDEAMGIRNPDKVAAAEGERPRSRRAEAIRLAFQIALAHLAGVVLPFVAYVLLAEAGINIVPVVYIGVVITLVVTAFLIWLEGLYSLKIRNPPELEGPAPPATGIIAAYLPNEAATIVDTVEAFLRIEYPGDFQVILAYNTPRDLPIEAVLRRIAARDPRFLPIRVPNSTSKAQNVNAALAEAKGEIIGVFDADHHPMPAAFTRAWRWIASGYDIVQGHCVVRNGAVSPVARSVAVEFESIYGVSHPGRERLHDFGIFGGSNGYWRADLLRQTRMHGFMLTEDIDSSIRVVSAGYKICADPGLVSEELAPVTVRSFWNQRMRWAQGWFQVSRKHFRIAMRSKNLTLRQKGGMVHLLWWREVYPWLSLQMWPIIGYWIWTYGSARKVDWLIPIFVLTSIFTLSVGPGQVLFAYLNAAPQVRRYRGWFWLFLVTAPVYSEFKNVIARVAQVKELMGDRQWKVTPRGIAERPQEIVDELAGDELAGRRATLYVLAIEPDPEPEPEAPMPLDAPDVEAAPHFEADWSRIAGWAPGDDWHALGDLLVNDGTGSRSLLVAPYTVDREAYAVEAEVRLMCAEAYGGVFEVMTGIDAGSNDPVGSAVGAGFVTATDGDGPSVILTAGHDLLSETPWSIDNDWHTLRLVVRRNELRFLIDGNPVTEWSAAFGSPRGRIGLWSDGAPARIRALRVLTLEDQESLASD